MASLEVGVKRVVGLFLAGVAASAIALGSEPSPPPGAVTISDTSGPAALMIALDFDALDGRGKPVVALKASEVEIRQDGQAQVVSRLEFDPARGVYSVQYTPRSGKPGPVNLRVLRSGVSPRGPGGGPLRPRVIEALRPFEVPLVAALDGAPRQDFVLPVATLHFEPAAEGLHHTFVVDLPLSSVQIEDKRRAHVSLVARVRAADGTVVRRTSLDAPIETAPEENLKHQRVVWISHLHLAPGRYSFEAAAADRLGDRLAVTRQDVVVPAARPGLSLSSTTLLQPDGARASTDGGSDDPLRTADGGLVPSVTTRYVAGSNVQLPFFVVAYRDSSNSVPVELSFELRQSGELVAGGPLGTLELAKEVRYSNTIPLARLPPGSYELRLLARQGAATAEATQGFQLLGVEQYLNAMKAAPATGPAPY
jgi:hypothetical protein